MPLNPQPIIDLASAFYGSCLLFTASDIGIFGKLAELENADARRWTPMSGQPEWYDKL